MQNTPLPKSTMGKVISVGSDAEVPIVQDGLNNSIAHTSTEVPNTPRNWRPNPNIQLSHVPALVTKTCSMCQNAANQPPRPRIRIAHLAEHQANAEPIILPRIRHRPKAPITPPTPHPRQARPHISHFAPVRRCSRPWDAPCEPTLNAQRPSPRFATQPNQPSRDADRSIRIFISPSICTRNENEANFHLFEDAYSEGPRDAANNARLILGGLD